ncbi:MAG: hypothetical protein J6A77_10530 [Lachnospiraceae bacterium]|nr:hypothetical protein [Lachnospiraceae bacterium]
MAICKHCGAEFEDGLESCPNCGQTAETGFGDFFEPDEELEEEAYNIFDAPEEFDLDSLLSKEFQQEERKKEPVSEAMPEMLDFGMEEPEEAIGFAEDPIGFGEPEADASEEMELAQMLGLSEADVAEAMTEQPPEEMEAAPVEEPLDDLGFLLQDEGSLEELSPDLPEGDGLAGDDLIFPEMEETDFAGLDELFQDMEGESGSGEPQQDDVIVLDQELEDLIAASGTMAAAGAKAEAGEKKKGKNSKKEKKEKKPFFKRVFGNVPVDPSKKKPEPTPEELEEKKKKEEEEKKQKAQEKKLAAEEKKEAAKAAKEEKARQKALAKEEKKAKKLEEAKQILEDMQETRINRVGATIVFVFFALIAVGLFFGSDLFGYNVSVNNAEESFNRALNNDVKYYTDAYNEIYGLEVKPEEQVLSDKIMTVMFVNQELNSYNSYMVMENYQAALHSLLQGLYRYGKYYEQAIPLGIDRDMDYVRTQILKALESTFHVSEDEAEVLRSRLEDTMPEGTRTALDKEAELVYNLELYKVLMECGLVEE